MQFDFFCSLEGDCRKLDRVTEGSGFGIRDEGGSPQVRPPEITLIAGVRAARSCFASRNGSLKIRPPENGLGEMGGGWAAGIIHYVLRR